jgi:magnesium chelatase subunit D
MAAEARMKETKNAILSLLLSAYQRRDQIALMVFKGKQVKLVLPPTNSVELAARHLTDLTVGGSTPLAAALFQLKSFLTQWKRRDPLLRITVLLVTDGRGNVSVFGQKPKEEIERLARWLRHTFPEVEFVVIDTETGAVRLEMAKKLAALLKARYFTPEALKAEHLFRIAKDQLGQIS